MAEEINLSDEPVFKDVHPELSAYPGLKEAYIRYASSYGKKNIIQKEDKYLWPFITSTGR